MCLFLRALLRSFQYSTRGSPWILLSLTREVHQYRAYPWKLKVANGILGDATWKPKEDKGKTIEKYTPKTSSQEMTSNIKCFKCLGRGRIASQCPTKKTMIMRGQDIYSSQEKTSSFPSSSGSEDEVRGEESSEEVYHHEEGDLLMVRRLLRG